MRERYSYLLDGEGFEKCKDKGVNYRYEVNILNY